MVGTEILHEGGPSNTEPIPSSEESPDTDEMIITSYMDPELYRAATIGDDHSFERAVSDAKRKLIENVTPRRNSILHLAASSGHDSIVNIILQRYPDLVELKNDKGDLPLHVAASAGRLTVVQNLVSNSAEDPEKVPANLMREKNQQENTPLHMALENGQLETALFLVQADPEVSHSPNSEGKSPFYMAIRSGYLDIVKHIATQNPSKIDGYNQGKETGFAEDNPLEEPKVAMIASTDSNGSGSSEDNPPEEPEVATIASTDSNGSGSSEDNPPEEPEEATISSKDYQLLHASVIGRNKDVMDIIWSMNPSLIHTTDKEWGTPLSLAASIGFVDGVCYILDKSPHSTYVRDRNGSFPIHWACMKGHIEIIDAFLRHCPDSAELLSWRGENILHVAAKNGRAKLVSWMLKLSKLDMLINEKDKEGFTPLHWATSNSHPKVVTALTWDKRVNLKIMNNKRLTAMDIAEQRIHPNAPFRVRLTRTALKSANAPRSEKANKRREKMMTGRIGKPKKGPKTERVDTLLLVATLVATVTFACGFTLPGGINNSDPDSGMATMVTKAAFQAFVICNNIALYGSIIVAITLIWAQLGDVNLMSTALEIAVPLLGVALVAMSIAFISGVYLVVSNHRWLAIMIVIMGSISTVILSAVIFLLWFPLSSKRTFMRYLMYYPIELVILVTRSDVEKLIEV